MTVPSTVDTAKMYTQAAVDKIKARVQNISEMHMFRRMNWVIQNIVGGRRDLYNVFGYTANVTYDMRFLKYLRQDVAARIVDAPALALWTNPPTITSNSEPWNTLWDDLIARYNLYSAIERADKLAGIGRYSLLLIGYNDGMPLDQPVNTRSLTQKKEKILYIQPYSERTAQIESYNLDSRSDEFMKPLMYRINPMDEYVIGFDRKAVIRNPSSGTPHNQSFGVHASRIVHVAENILENGIFGSPRMERVYNILDDLLKVTGGSAETFWLVANRGLHIDIDKDMEIDKQDAEDLKAEIDEYENQLRRVIRTRGTKINSLGSDTPDPTGVFKVLISMLSGATGIPNRILIGAEAGQLASEQDRANWADRIDERRASWGNPHVLFPVIKKLTRAGYLPSEESTEITVDWPNAFKMSPLENAQTSAQHARSATNFAKAIETMENLKRGDPGTPETTGPDGTKVPGKPAVPGVEVEDLVTVEEARKMMWLDKPAVTFDSGEDVSSPRRQHARRVQISVGRILRF